MEGIALSCNRLQHVFFIDLSSVCHVTTGERRPAQVIVLGIYLSVVAGVKCGKWGKIGD